MAKLTDRKRQLLDSYLREKRVLIDQTPTLTTSELCGWVREALKFDVDTSNITHRVGPTGKLWHKQWPGSDASRKGRLTDKRRMHIIVEQLELFRIQITRLGHELGSGGLGAQVAEWSELVAQIKEDVADVDHREPEER